MKTITHIKTFRVWNWLLLSVLLCGCWSYTTKEAVSHFENREEPFSVTVFPVNVVKGLSVDYDENLAQRIVAFLLDENLADPVFDRHQVEIPLERKRIQSAMIKQTARAFPLLIQQRGIETEYALLVEFLCNSKETHLGAVHVYLADRKGNLAAFVLSNSHWEDFKEVQPKDRQGGFDIAIRMMARHWGRGSE